MKKIKKILRTFGAISICLNLIFNVAYAADFSGSRSSTYDLSNGKRVRIEYHNGQPHIHEVDKKGNSVGSENINDNERHHNNEGGISKGTRDIVKNGKTKSQQDERAAKKAKEYGDEYKQAVKDSKNAKKSFVEKNKDTIQRAADRGKFCVIIGGTLYIIWWLFKIASGWGILIPV